VTTVGVAPLRSRDVRIVTGGLIAASAVWPRFGGHFPTTCPLRAATGVPCPFCGMTRACVAAVHGHLARSIVFNPAGVLVIVAAVVLLVRPALVRRIRFPVWLAPGALGALWVWNVGFNPTFHQLLVR
jgi:hypothetical protein